MMCSATGSRRAWTPTEPERGGTTTTRYAYDGWKTPVDGRGNPYPLVGSENWDVWADLNGSNALQARYLRGEGVDQIVARISSGGLAVWYLADRQGSIRDLADASGAVVDHLDYDGYGKTKTETNPSAGDRYLFTAREYDSETGLYYSRARYYDPQAGRWTTEDPDGFSSRDINLYRYVRNGPTRGTDPSGLFSTADHEEITTTAIERWAQGKSVSGATLGNIRATILAGNRAQDEGQSFNTYFLHFNREFIRSETDAETNPGEALARRLRGREWDGKYLDYLKEERAIFHNILELAKNKVLGPVFSPPGPFVGPIDPTLLPFIAHMGYATSSLESLGRLTHAWQDFYAHAVRADQGGTTHVVGRQPFFAPGPDRSGRLGSENSDWPGFSAYADRDARTGDPELHPALMPSSYSLAQNAEHPITQEPLRYRQAEYNARKAEALKYTTDELGKLLNEWFATFGNIFGS